MNNIVLIGMPSSGKTTKGMKISEILRMKTIDTDELIFEKSGKTPADIVRTQGRDEFLRIQDAVVAAIETDNTVISTGGGIIYSQKAMEKLKSEGIVVFLNTPIHSIKERVRKDRSLSSGKGKSIEDIFVERQPFYKGFADIEILCEDMKEDEIVAEIIRRIK